MRYRFEHLVIHTFIPLNLLQNKQTIVVLVWNISLVYQLMHWKPLKELEHRQLGWKVLILKYDLGKSLSKEMWCKMADTKNIWLIF